MQIRVRQNLPEDHIIVQITTEDRSYKRQRRAKVQGFNDILLHILCCGCCQSYTGNSWHAFTQAAQFEVIWPEIVPPLGDAVSLVYSQVRHKAAAAQVCQTGLERGGCHHLRGDVEQLQLGAAAAQVGQDQPSLGNREFRVDGAGRNVQALQAVHLVLSCSTRCG